MHLLRRTLPLLVLASILPAQEVESLARRVPAGWENVYRLGDVMPIAERLLTSRAFGTAWERAGDSLASIEPGLRDLDPRAMLAGLGLVAAQVPTEVVFAAPESTIEDLGALYEGLVTAFLGWAIVERGRIDEPLLEGYREDVVASLASVFAPEAYLGLRVRDARVAEDWFDAIADAVAAFGEATPYDTRGAIDPDEDDGGGLVFLIVPDEIQLRIEVERLLESGRLGGVDVWSELDRRGILPADEPATRRLRAVVADLTVELRLVRSDDVLELEVGGAEAARLRGALQVARVADGTVFDARWATGEFIAHAERHLELLSELGPDSIDCLEAFRPGAFDQLWSNAWSMTEYGARGRLAVSVGDDVAEVRLWEPHDPTLDWTPPAVRDTGITGFVPEPKSWTTATGYLTLDEWLFWAYDDLAWGLDDIAVEAQVRGLDGLFELFDGWSSALLVDFEELYDFLGDEDSAVFRDGTVFVLDAKGDGAPAWAVVGLPDSRRDAEEFVTTVARLVLEGAGVDATDPTTTLASRDGPEIRVLSLPGAPRDGDALERAPFAPHAVVLEDALILSTRAALTRELLDARARGGAFEIEDDLVTDGRASGEGAAAVLAAATRSLPDRGADLRLVRTVLDALGALASAVGDVRFTERLEDGGLATRVRIGLRE